MVKAAARKGEILLCGTCMDARGIADVELIEGIRRSTMDELAERTLAADRVLMFCPRAPAVLRSRKTRRDRGSGLADPR
jgi:hypothetical protein